jgi:nucleotide-binding universal stress UspA family protein
MTDDRLITVAIHTYDKALMLKNLLENEGLQVVLHNVNLSQPVVSSGVRVRIKESDLPLALRIIENAEIFTSATTTELTSRKQVLVPVDFSDYSLRAVMFAFNIAHKHKAEILLLHSFINPAVTKRVQLTDALSFELTESQEVENQMMKAAKENMDKFSDEIRGHIKQGSLPPVLFKSQILEGVPEDVIVEQAKAINPLMIVMGTRGSDRKEVEMIGSVTAEVLDSCRYPVFTIPESVTLQQITDVGNVIFYVNLDQEDILAMDALHRLFADDSLNITLVHIPTKKERDDANKKAANNLLDYFRNLYSNYTFELEQIRPNKALEDFKEITGHHDVNLIVMANKKRNVFARFFNPSLAHKMLLHADIPMIVIPV